MHLCETQPSPFSSEIQLAKTLAKHDSVTHFITPSKDCPKQARDGKPCVRDFLYCVTAVQEPLLPFQHTAMRSVLLLSLMLILQ